MINRSVYQRVRRLSQLLRFNQWNQVLYKYDYGQRGVLRMNLAQSQEIYDINLRTTWEDYCQILSDKPLEQQQGHYNFYEEDNGRIAIITDNEAKKNAKRRSDSGKIKLVCEIPEYFSYEIITRGNVNHTQGSVDAKIYGDVQVDILDQTGEYSVNKCKTEKFELRLLDGGVKVRSYLESYQMNLESQDSNIEIKKLLVSGRASIKVRNSTIKLGSTFTNHAPQQQVQPGENTSELFRVNQLSSARPEISQFFNLKQNRINIEGEKINSEISFCHGNLSLVAQKFLNLKISNLSAQQIFIDSTYGDVRIGPTDLKQDSYVKNQSILLFSCERFAHNIYDLQKQAYLKQSSNPRSPTIFLDSSNITIE